MQTHIFVHKTNRVEHRDVLAKILLAHFGAFVTRSLVDKELSVMRKGIMQRMPKVQYCPVQYCSVPWKLCLSVWVIRDA